MRPLKRQPILKSAAETVLADRRVGSLPRDTVVPLERARDVLLLTSRRGTSRFRAETYSQEVAFAAEMAARGRPFAVTDDPSGLFGKRVMWFHPPRMVTPPLWDHARQVREFAAGLELQGNTLFCSAAETAYWENKAFMHRRLDEVGAATPRTLVVGEADRTEPAIGFEPLLVKEEHSAGSSGIHFFATADEARAFVAGYAFKPTESLIVQEVVPGATRDLRLTLVGDRVIRSATYWRAKSADALAASEWTTTATTYGSTVDHAEPPAGAVEACTRILRDLGVRTAGIDLMWAGDDVTGEPLMLELSPFYQPNPPMPASADGRSYKAFKSARYARDGYFRHQHLAFREIASAILDQDLF
jgi:hypothetical protein